MNLTPPIDMKKYIACLLCLISLSMHFWGFVSMSFLKNMRPEKLGKIMYTAPRIHAKITNYIRY